MYFRNNLELRESEGNEEMVAGFKKVSIYMLRLLSAQVFLLILLLSVYVIIIIDRFYIALFSALKQTHCARM